MYMCDRRCVHNIDALGLIIVVAKQQSIFKIYILVSNKKTTN